MDKSKLSFAVNLHNRTLQLEIMIKQKHHYPSDFDHDRALANQFNVLRDDVKRFFRDPDFDHTIPRVWCLTLTHALIFIALFVVALASVYLVEQANAGNPRAFFPTMTFIIGMVGLMILITGGLGAGLASSVPLVLGRTNMLEAYLRERIAELKGYMLVDSKLATQLGHYDEKETAVSRAMYLQRQLDDQGKQLAEANREITHLRELLDGLETPTKFEAAEQILDKLNPLERIRMLEAIQAYRVNAWTPAAAICGIILEGRLQQLCKINNIPQGGIGEMIQRLGEAHLLKEVYQNLARVGEFFRHRSSHPTTEEFDREKTTLILTSLVILIRDLF
jgi:hypothetical protein